LITDNDIVKLNRATGKVGKFDKLFLKNNKLIELKEKLRMLLPKLEMALIIKALWPEAFKSDGCKVNIEGQQGDIDKVKFMIETSDGINKEFNILDIPRVLFEHTIKHNCSFSERYKSRTMHYYNKYYKEDIDEEEKL